MNKMYILIDLYLVWFYYPTFTQSRLGFFCSCKRAAASGSLAHFIQNSNILIFCFVLSSAFTFQGSDRSLCLARNDLYSTITTSNNAMRPTTQSLNLCSCYCSRIKTEMGLYARVVQSKQFHFDINFFIILK